MEWESYKIQYEVLKKAANLVPRYEMQKQKILSRPLYRCREHNTQLLVEEDLWLEFQDE